MKAHGTGHLERAAQVKVEALSSLRGSLRNLSVLGKVQHEVRPSGNFRLCSCTYFVCALHVDADDSLMLKCYIFVLVTTFSLLILLNNKKQVKVYKLFYLS